MKAILNKLNACQEAVEWAENKPIEEIINTCHRGDWLLWLARKLDVDFQKLTLARGLCANTVRHLMKDERSIKAVDTAIAFGKGEVTQEELDDASAYASAYASADASAKKENQLLTAKICRDVLGEILIEKCKNFKSE